MASATVITQQEGPEGNLMVHADSSLGAAVVGALPHGAKVEIIGAAANGFIPVRFGGVSGWASANYLRAGLPPLAIAGIVAGGAAVVALVVALARRKKKKTR